MGFEDYEIKQISTNVYMINEFNLSTMFLIVGSERALAIDCGVGVSDYLNNVIRKITLLPVVFAVTHAHVDHIGGRGQFDEMYLSEKDAPLVRDVTSGYRRFYLGLTRVQGIKTISPKQSRIEKTLNEPVQRYIKDGDVFELGGKTVKVLETPGHTVGSISYLLVEDKILITGDILNIMTFMFLKGTATVQTLIRTLEKVREYSGYDVIWPSHSPNPMPDDMIANGLRCVDEACARKNSFLPFYAKKKFGNVTLIYRTHLRHDK